MIGSFLEHYQHYLCQHGYHTARSNTGSLLHESRASMKVALVLDQIKSLLIPSLMTAVQRCEEKKQANLGVKLAMKRESAIRNLWHMYGIFSLSTIAIEFYYLRRVYIQRVSASCVLGKALRSCSQHVTAYSARY